jgi:hypothetical protein
MHRLEQGVGLIFPLHLEVRPVAFDCLGSTLGALIAAALVITRALTEPPRGWAAFFVGVGGCAGIVLTELLVRTLGYPFTREPDGMALCFILTSLGAFLGTYGYTQGPR